MGAQLCCKHARQLSNAEAYSITRPVVFYFLFQCTMSLQPLIGGVPLELRVLADMVGRCVKKKTRKNGERRAGTDAWVQCRVWCLVQCRVRCLVQCRVVLCTELCKVRGIVLRCSAGIQCRATAPLQCLDTVPGYSARHNARLRSTACVYMHIDKHACGNFGRKCMQT